jgi:hypothetical protein
MKHHAARHLTRRHALQSAAALLLVGCGGGGGDSNTPADPGTGAPPPGNDAGPSGWLVYRNSSGAEVFDFATGRATDFDPGDSPSVDPGMSAAPGRLAVAAQAGDNSSFAFATFDLAAQRKTLYDIQRTFAFQTSAVLFSGDGTRIAFSVNEPTSQTIDERIDRTFVFAWPSLELLAIIDGYESPVWARATGELLLREPDDGRLRVFGPALEDRGWLADVVVAAPYANAYDVSPDGRYVVFDDIVRLVGYDRQTAERWIVADRISSLRDPCFSPDGRYLAMHAIDLTSATTDFFVYLPHIVPFARGVTVEVDSARHRLASNIVETGGRFGWVV